ncbi:methyl-accepting chemotaxis protein [Paenibacillus taiwanensis]|uniref:methyl-accepting chemotaxis protein n=1 Tax=Paenibacillus taiwanensis TaxID=401638 RepID=UPI000425F691|nr:methyl-accepting chemotaxis protein [Paenibacillus taiwanensis]
MNWRKRKETTVTPSNGVPQQPTALAARNPFHSVGMKLFTLFLVSITVLVGGIGGFSYDRAQATIQEQVSLSQVQTVQQAGEKLDLLFQNNMELTNQILFDQDTQKLLTEAYNTKESDQYELFQLSKDIENKLRSYVFANHSLFGIYLIPIDKEHATIYSSGVSTTTMADERNKPWFDATLKLSGNVNWIPSSKRGLSGQSPKETYALARVVKNINTSQSMYVMVMEVYVQTLQEQLKWDKSSGGFAQIVDGAGKVVLANDLQLIGQEPQLRLDVTKDKSVDYRIVANTSGEDQLGTYYVSPVTGWTINGFTPMGELLKGTASIRNVTLISIVVAIIVALLLGWYVMRRIGKPLQRLRDLMEEGAQGKLGLQMNHRSKDEIGQLSVSFNTMMSRISELVQRTEQSAQAVLATASRLGEASRLTASSAKEIAVATEEIANGATSLAVEAERSNHWTESTSQKMLNVIEMNVDMYTAATEVQAASQRGTHYMVELNHKTETTETMIRSLVSKVDALKESTLSVRKILELLTQMTKQTNILSLNAAIEAARAGAAGKGFMVVADEIRSLADQSKQSIEVVGQILESIQREVNETVMMLGDAYPIFKEQLEAVKEADHIFHTVEDQMVQLFTKLDYATAGVNELDESQRILTEAMSNVSAVAEESSATSEEVASLSNEQMTVSARLVDLSNELEQVSDQLMQQLDQFTMER